MELAILDPFGDYESAGYLRNFLKEKDQGIVAHLEAAAFEDQIHGVIRFVRRLPKISYENLTEIHRRFFESVYPWAGRDRLETAPNIAIGKAGIPNMFAHPADVRRAADYALRRAHDVRDLRQHPGEIYGYFAHAHPFLEGNGRTILTVFAEMCRRADFHVRWEKIEKRPFLEALTDELLHPGSRMDEFISPYLRPGSLSAKKSAVQLSFNFNRE
jgi:cell filamentation protein